jgi:hypothetical protein
LTTSIPVAYHRRDIHPRVNPWFSDKESKKRDAPWGTSLGEG